MSEEWKPDPKVLEDIKEALDSDPQGRYRVGSRILKGKDLFREICEGTQFGRRFYKAYVGRS